MDDSSTLTETNTPGSVSIAEILSTLGADLVSPFTPVDPNQLVTETDLYDTLGSPPRISGTLLLAPMAQELTSQAFSELLRYAREHKCAAVAIKITSERKDEFQALAKNASFSVLQVATGISWSTFEALLNRLIGENSRTATVSIDRSREPLFGLVNELASFFGGSVVIEDLGRRILAYSSVPGQAIDHLRTEGILLRKVPESPFNNPQYRELLQSQTVLFFGEQGLELPRTAIPIRAGNVPLGSIWAIDPREEGKHNIAETEERLQAAASLAASYIIDALHHRQATQIPREQRLRTLISGTGVQGGELAELGFFPDPGVELIALDPDAKDNPNLLAQLHAAAQNQISSYLPEVVTAVDGPYVWILLPNNESFSGAKLIPRLLKITDKVLGDRVRAALPGTCRSDTAVTDLAKLANQLFRADQRYPAPAPRRILTPTQLTPIMLYQEIAQVYEMNPQLLREELSELIEEEPVVAHTLMIWCANRGNVAACARDLAVHENTVRSRLQRIVNHYGLALDDPDEFFMIWAQLRTLRQLPADYSV
ncbi:helix-turn-helix domain-containing protein [Canibacter zhoujuaniae]|uniref:helix-turn-helix domain-containing protein n=1 Tax=Canibacter zhoujuaniae TaxID=2708343 RepID=UPI00142028C1|nr:helix-turn-helix domain-containing protein [Canibacter zhoujuaniae]